MAYEAELRHGHALMVDYEGVSDVSAGTVVVIGDYPFIAHQDYDASAKQKGALAARGGVYRCVPDAAMTAGKKVYFVAADNEVSETAASNKHFGYTVSASYDSDGFVDVLHSPEGFEGSA